MLSSFTDMGALTSLKGRREAVLTHKQRNGAASQHTGFLVFIQATQSSVQLKNGRITKRGGWFNCLMLLKGNDLKRSHKTPL